MAVDLTSSPTAVGAVITELRVLHEEAMADRLPCGWDRRQQSGQNANATSDASDSEGEVAASGRDDFGNLVRD